MSSLNWGGQNGPHLEVRRPPVRSTGRITPLVLLPAPFLTQARVQHQQQINCCSSKGHSGLPLHSLYHLNSSNAVKSCVNAFHTNIVIQIWEKKYLLQLRSLIWISAVYTGASVCKIVTVENHAVKIIAPDLAEVRSLVTIFTCNQLKRAASVYRWFCLSEESSSNKLTLRHWTHNAWWHSLTQLHCLYQYT